MSALLALDGTSGVCFSEIWGDWVERRSISSSWCFLGGLRGVNWLRSWLGEAADGVESLCGGGVTGGFALRVLVF